MRRGKHIFDEDTVPRGGIVDQNMRDRPHELAVLDDRGARHSLNDTACLFDQRGVGDLDGEAFV